MSNKKPIIIVLFIIFPVARMAKQPKACSVTDAVNKQKEQERVQKLVDEVAREIELSCNSGCPAGWVRHGNACYYIYDTPTIKWADAREKCQNKGADLLIIKSSDENKFIIDLAKKQDTTTFLGVWLGMQRKDKTSKLDFYWIDDSSVKNQAYLNWNRGEPSMGPERDEHCGNMYLHNGKWNDLRCECVNYNDVGVENCPVVVCQKKIANL